MSARYQHEEAFRAAFDEYYRPVKGYLNRMLGDAEAGEDVAQEVFCRLYFKAPDDLENVKAWLYTVATNLGINYIRSEKARRNREMTAMDTVLPERAAHPERISDRRLIVQEALAALPERDRMCLMMKHEGFSYDEIARAIRVEKGSVGTLLARAHEKFRRQIEQKGVNGREML